jgi:hypothetical protein
VSGANPPAANSAAANSAAANSAAANSAAANRLGAKLLGRNSAQRDLPLPDLASPDLPSPDLPGSDLRVAAFGGRPELSVFAATDPHEPARDRWLAAVVLGGQGRYAAAAALLRGLLRGPDPVVAALSASTIASHLRQMGGHAAARRFDATALRLLTSTDPHEGQERDGTGRTGARVDALLGLSADAIGLGQVAEARRLLAAARRCARQAWHPPVEPVTPIGSGGSKGVDGLIGVADPPSVPWRVTVRVEWLATEVELAAGRPGDAEPHAERAVGIALAAGAVRHTVKSTMMLGASVAAGGTPDGRSRATGLLTEALATSLTRGMFPLVWPCALLLADLAPDRAAERTTVAADALTRIFSWSEPSMRRIATASPWMPTALIRSGGPTRTGVELTT